jgi:hypothetical protein
MRSIDKAWRVHKAACEGIVTPARATYWFELASTWDWRTRAAAWDAGADEETRTRAALEQATAAARHARLVQGALATLSLPVHAALVALADPAVAQTLADQCRRDPALLLELIRLVTQAAGVIPGLVAVERRALGLTRVAADGRTVRPVALPTDPGTTALVQALFERLEKSTNTQQTPSTPAVTAP